MRDWAKFAGFAAFLTVALCGSLLWALHYPPQNIEWVCRRQSDATQPNNQSLTSILCAPNQVYKLEEKPAAAEGAGNQKGDSTTDGLLVLFTFMLVIVGAFQAFFLWGTLRVTEKVASAGKDAAEAAKLNAEAVMNAEGAALYPVMVKTNIKEVFQGPILHDTMPGDTLTPAPKVRYCFKNFGKTPAVFESAMHNIRFIPEGSGTRTMTPVDRPLEIIMSDQASGDITCDMFGETLNFGKAKSVLRYEGTLLFFGEVFFRDFFNRRFQCYWEFDGRPDGFHLTKIHQRPNPDPELQPDPRMG